MIKLTDLLNEIEQERREQQLEEGWKENIVAAAMAASTLFGGIKGQTPGMGNIGNKAGIEQSTIKQVKQGPLDVNFGAAFPSGRYLIKGPSQDTLVNKLEEIGKYIAKNPTSDYKIEIISSESQVPNYDAEKLGRVKLNTGELAEKRATVINAAIKEFTDNLKQQGVLKGNIDIKTSPALVGSEKFTAGVDNKDDAKYTKDQFVKVKITATPKSVPNKTHVKASATDTEPIYAPGEGSKVNPAIGEIWYTTRVAVDNESGTVNYNPGDVYAIRFLKDFKDWGKDDQGNKIRSVNGDINQNVYEPGIYYIKKGDWMKVGGSAKNMSREKLQSLIDQSGVPASITNN
jgi:hypothetical protein